jgi:hypothetical protein
VERAKWGSGAVLAVVLGVLALLAAYVGADVGGDGAGDAPGPTKPAAGPVPVGVTPPRIPSSTQLPGRPYGIGFATDGGGFALLAQRGEKRCRQRVAVLDRGADTWRLGRSPLSDVTGEGMTAGLITLGTGRALITEG